MKLLIISDIHGNLENLKKVVKLHKDADHILCAGDIGLSKVDVEKYNVIAVKGNCDYYLDMPLERILDLGDKKILLTHGHLENVKYGIDALIHKAKSHGVDIVCFGHIHYPILKEIDNILFINPGALSDIKGQYAIYENGVVSFYELY